MSYLRYLFLLVLLASCGPFDHMALIEHYSKKHKLPVSLVLAWVDTESQFNSNAVGALGEKGYCQVWEKYHHPGCNLFNPHCNLNYACGLLQKYYQEDFSIRNALAKYNGGPNGHTKIKALKYADKILFKKANKYERIRSDADRIF